jgi:hypothetical protein
MLALTSVKRAISGGGRSFLTAAPIRVKIKGMALLIATSGVRTG